MYKQFRNRVASELRESKKKSVRNYFNVNSNNMQLLWTGIKSITRIKNSHVNVINKLRDQQGNLSTDSANTANIVNNFLLR